MINNRSEGGWKASEGRRDELTNGVRGVAHALVVGAGDCYKCNICETRFY